MFRITLQSGCALIAMSLPLGLSAPGAVAATLSFENSGAPNLMHEVAPADHDASHGHSHSHDHAHGHSHDHDHDHSGGLHAIYGQTSEGAPSGAFATINEAALDAIFGQASFQNAGGTVGPIDVRVLATQTLARADLLNVTTEAQQDEFFPPFGGQGVDVFPSPTINVFFVDTVDFCGGFNTSIIGCGSTPGNTVLVESVFAASASGDELIAHEVAHNLGLLHRTNSTALLNPSINGGTDINITEARDIFGLNPNGSNDPTDPLPAVLQSDGQGYFIEIAPIVVVAPVPLPAGGALLLGALGILGLVRRYGPA